MEFVDCRDTNLLSVLLHNDQSSVGTVILLAILCLRDLSNCVLLIYTQSFGGIYGARFSSIDQLPIFSWFGE